MIAKESRRFGALIGVSAVIAGLAAAQLLASLNKSLNNPVVSIGNRIIDHVPANVKVFVIRTFGINDKNALVLSIYIIIFLLAIVIGRTYTSGKRNRAYSAVIVLSTIGAVASLFDSGATIFSLLPSLAAGIMAILILRSFGRHNLPTGQGEFSMSRRELVRTLSLIGIGSFVAIGVARYLQEHTGAQLARLNIALPKPLKFLPTPPIDPAITTPGLSTLFTPNSQFYRIDTAIVVPSISVDTWRLKIDGMVKNSGDFTYQELIQRPVFELDDTIACVSNEVGGNLIGNARWLGIRLDDLIKEAAPTARADQVMGYSSDGFSAGFPLAILDGRDAMIAFGMNGQPLPLEHGFPARIIVPGLYGYVSATKWLTHIELTRFDQKEGYWIPRGWSALGPIKTESRVDTPRDGSNIKSGPIAIAGVAWAPTRGISLVEVKVGDGPWRAATLGPQLAKTTWRQWWIDWSASTGKSTISVRATDGTGILQPSNITQTAPNGAQGWHTINVTVG
jgi:DMSO/TMAO reductase YedYZ molybdopterin-dependent catalytic subunit